MDTIVKVQVSIFGKPATLVYNESRSIELIFDRKIGEKALGKDLKGYFKAKIKGNTIELGKRLKKQNW